VSGELSIGIVFSFNKGGAKVSRSETLTIDVAGDAFSHEIQSIGTGNVALVEGAAVGTPGYILVKNLDDSNFVEVGITGSYTIKLLAGEVALFRADAAIYAKADTAACLVEYVIIEA